MRVLLLLLIAIIFFSSPLVLSDRLFQQLSDIPGNFNQVEPAPIDAATLTDTINKIRQENKLPPLLIGQKTCLMAEASLDNQSLDVAIIARKCPECRLVQIARFSQPLDVGWFKAEAQTNASASAYLFSAGLTHLCVATSSTEVAIALVSAQPAVSSPPKVVSTPKNFTQEELWNALSTYRQSQGKSSLTQDGNLCNYAQKRVADHLDMIAKGIEPEAYPLPAKYPLDAHQGFKQDAETGLVFEITKKNQVAENLAYWPNALDPIHVIEWGWDTSTEGHREAQLSDEWTSACVAGENGFYVAIFAK